MSEKVRVLEGTLVSENKAPAMEIIENRLQAEDVIEKGLLFIGAAGQGKTNVMMKVSSDLLQRVNKGDLIIFFDVKGDYYNTFYEQGDVFLSPADNTYLWNIFEDFENLKFGSDLEYRIRETIEYLFVGMQSEREPFWTNGAKMVLYCLILYMLMEADIEGDYSKLNHLDLCALIDGELEGRTDLYDCYDNYRDILNSNVKFRSAGMFLPPTETGTAMGHGIITEILAMKNRLLIGNFGSKIRRNDQQYISAASLPRMFDNRKGPGVMFLRYNQRYQDVCAPIYRCFVDMVIASYLESINRFGGKLYLVLDELAVLPELRRLDQALELGRQYGIRIIAGLQEIEQMRQNYRTNQHLANVIVGGFQSTVVFKCDTETMSFVKDKLGKVLIQRVYTRPGGGKGITEPVLANVIESYDFNSFDHGDAIIKILGDAPYKAHFPLYKVLDIGL